MPVPACPTRSSIRLSTRPAIPKPGRGHYCFCKSFASKKASAAPTVFAIPMISGGCCTRQHPQHGVSRSPAAPTIDDEKERAAASPPPLWGRDRVGGLQNIGRRGSPTLAPPHVVSQTRLRHDEEGKPRAACLWLHQPNSCPAE